MMLCIGYGLYAAANCMMLFLLYFEDYRGALTAVIPFAVISTGGSIFQILRGGEQPYGLSFVLGAAVFFLQTWTQLDRSTDQLDYLLLGRQRFSDVRFRGLLERAGDQLEKIRFPRHHKVAWEERNSDGVGRREEML